MEFVRKLDQIEVRFDELTRQLADPAVINDAEQYRKTAKAQAELSDIVTKYREWKEAAGQLGQARAMMSDSDPASVPGTVEKNWRFREPMNC